MYSSVAIAVCLLVKSSISWGTEGHEIVGSIAQQFLSATAQSKLNSILTESKGDLSSVANWADKVKFTAQYYYTKTLHYIDVNDAPPNKCELDENRDCADGKCIVGAIATYSNQVLCSQDLQPQADAAKFLVHFFGDLTQPLHNENRARGGNDNKVTFGGKPTNLHTIWDVNLVQGQIAKHASQDGYVQYLVNQIKSETYNQTADSWISRYSHNQLSSNGNSLAALDYSADSNQYDCGAVGVWSAYDQNPTQDFSGAYAEMVGPIIDIQLAKGGYRLGVYLSELLSSTCSERTPPPPTFTRSGPQAESQATSTIGRKRPRHTSRTVALQ